MKTLNQQYDILLRTYSRLEDLITTALVKTMRAADAWLKEHIPQASANTLPAQQHEDTIDMLAYNDAINRRFEHYYGLTLTYLKYYLKEKHALCLVSPHKIFHACYEQELLAQDDIAELLKIAKYAQSIRKPYNSEGDYTFSDEILIYTVTLKEITTKLNPTTISHIKPAHNLSVEHCVTSGRR